MLQEKLLRKFSLSGTGFAFCDLYDDEEEFGLVLAH